MKTTTKAPLGEPCKTCGRAAPGRKPRVNPKWNGEKMRRHRRIADITQAQLAERLGVRPGTIGTWERGTVPTNKTITRLERILKTKLR